MRPPSGPYQFVGVVFAGPLPSKLAHPTGYEAKLPRSTPTRPAPDEFTIGKYFGEDVDADEHLRDLCGWTAEVIERDGLTVLGFLLFGRVTNEAPGFGVTVSPDVISAIAQLGATLDVSVYVR